MARQIKNHSCCEQIAKGDVTSRTSLFGTVKNIFKLNRTISEGSTLSYGTARKAEDSEIMAIQAQVVTAQVQFRRLQMIQ